MKHAEKHINKMGMVRVQVKPCTWMRATGSTISLPFQGSYVYPELKHAVQQSNNMGMVRVTPCSTGCGQWGQPPACHSKARTCNLQCSTWPGEKAKTYTRVGFNCSISNITRSNLAVQTPRQCCTARLVCSPAVSPLMYNMLWYGIRCVAFLTSHVLAGVSAVVAWVLCWSLKVQHVREARLGGLAAAAAAAGLIV
jgi:hypothetical protein